MKFEYYGKYLHRIHDEAGRVVIPAKLRKKLKGWVIITPSPDGCLTVYPGDEKNGIPINRQGIVLIPRPLREYANLQKEIVVVGCIEYIEIWDRGRWQEKEKESPEIHSGNFS